MINYKDYEKEVYNWLKQKHKEDNSFTFSLRRNASKGSERDYFIGTQKSGYFATTFWVLPVSFPGSSGDCINLTFNFKNNDYTYKFEFTQTNSPTDLQSISALNLLKSLKLSLSEHFNFSYVSDDNNKMFSILLRKGEKSYMKLEEMLEDIEADLNMILPIVEKDMLKEKENNPDFVAHRITLSEFNAMQVKLEKRLKKHENVNSTEFKGIQIKDGVSENESSNLETGNYKASLNQILYGPPGTGKTYNTITEAIAIIQNRTFDEIKDIDRKIVKKDFDTLSKRKQVMFTTFHQSMSYEDFVEGIKPVIIDDTEKDNQDISYEIQGGIFKQAAARAAYYSYKEFHDVNNSGYTYSQLYEAFIEMAREKIAEKTFFTCETKTGSFVEIFRVNKNDSIHARAEGSLVTHVAPLTKENIQKLYDTYKSVDAINHLQEVRDVVGVTPRTTEFYAVFKALLNFEKNDFKPNKENEELKEIDLTDEEILLQFDSGVFTEMSRKFGSKSSRVVLVIDEINRGNVSAIFGELITLLEEDKRLGEANELVITLPYSKGQFSVPSNLYIVGTMNTADRSVEALDTALRRRFEFKEMMPDYSVIEDETVEDIKLSKVLKTINERIELLVDRDHTIGHSYFVNVNTTKGLANAFNNKIVPLLQEYFYGDYGKIGLVLGKGFIEKIKNDKIEFASFTYENSHDFKTPTFVLTQVDSASVVDAVHLLLGKEEEKEIG